VKCPLERVLLFLECLVFCGGKRHLIACLPYTLELLVGALGLLCDSKSFPFSRSKCKIPTSFEIFKNTIMSSKYIRK
jgi:hypothetical protein